MSGLHLGFGEGMHDITINAVDLEAPNETSGVVFPAINGIYNFNAAANSNILSALTEFKNNGTDVSVLSFGDSTVAGVGGGGGTGWTGAKTNINWVKALTEILSTNGIPANQNNIMGRGGAGAEFTNFITPWTVTFGGSGVAGTLGSLGGVTLIQITSADVGWSAVNFNTVTGNGAYITWLQYTAAAGISFEVSFDGGASVAATIGFAGNNGIQTTFVANPGAPSSIVSFRRAANAVQILGVDLVDTTSPTIRFINAGQGSSFTATWLVITNAFSLGNVYYKYGSKLAIIDLTINDRNSIADPAVPVANLLTMRNALLAQGCDTWIMVPPPGNNTTTVVLNAYRAAIIAMCAANNITCIDNMVTYDYAGWLAQGYLYDAVHPNPAGYRYMSDVLLYPAFSAMYNLA